MTALPEPEPEESPFDDTDSNITGVRRAGAGPRWQPGPPADLYADLRSAVSRHRLADEATDRQRANRSQRPPGQHAKNKDAAQRARRRRVVPRAAHQAFANLFGWFWVACPHCGQHFGGHEWRRMDRAADSGAGHIATLWTPIDQPRPAICPSCTQAGVGCLSHAAHGNRHARCPYLFALP